MSRGGQPVPGIEPQGQDSMREAVRAALERHFGEDGLAYWQTFFEPLAHAPWADVFAAVAALGVHEAELR